MGVSSGPPISYPSPVPTSHKSHDVAYDDAHHAIFTIDGRIREAALWEFPDPLTRCDKALTHCTGEPNVPPPIDNGAPATGRRPHSALSPPLTGTPPARVCYTAQ